MIAAGGTGGHLYPGLALGRALREKALEVVFVVKKNDASREILEQEQFAYREIPAAGMPRKPSLRIFTFFIQTIRGFFAARRMLCRKRPRSVFGMGGYVSFPVVAAAKLLGIRVIIHEQNVVPGLTNRILARLADAITVSFDETKKYFPKREVVVTGNPIRQELFSSSYEDAIRKLKLAKNKFTVLIFGGSQGSAWINKTVVDAWELLGDDRRRLQLLHISGKNDYEGLAKEYTARGIAGSLFPYVHEMGYAYEAADFIICRSGAMTVSELRILNKPALLIPFPFATDRHQYYNALVLKQLGMATVIEEKDLTASDVAENIREHLGSFLGHTRDVQLPEELPQELLAGLA